MRWHMLWMVASFAISLGLNHVMKPKVEHDLTPGQLGMATGTLRFDGVSEQLKIVNVFVIAQDLRRVLAEPLRVRELLVRSPAPSDGQEPDLELFFDFTADPVIDRDARDVAVLRERDLPLLPTAIGSETRSRVRFPGASTPAYAQDGHLRITQVYDLPGDVGASWRIEGDLHLVLNEGGHERTVAAKLNARLTW